VENPNGEDNTPKQGSGWNLKITNSDVSGSKSVDGFDIVLVHVDKNEYWDWLVDLFETVTDGPAFGRSVSMSTNGRYTTAGYTKAEAAASLDSKLLSRQKQTDDISKYSKQTPTTETAQEARILQFQLQSKLDQDAGDLAMNLLNQLSNQRRNSSDKARPIIYVGGKSTKSIEIMESLFGPKNAYNGKLLGIYDATAAIITMDRAPSKPTENSTTGENHNKIGSSENLNHDIEHNQSTWYETGVDTSSNPPNIKVLDNVVLPFKVIQIIQFF
jgi:hypothetical protein